MQKLALGGEFHPTSHRMISGRGLATSKEWIKIEALRGTWYVEPNREAEMMLFRGKGGGYSEGFGGATLKLKVIGEYRPGDNLQGNYAPLELHMYDEPQYVDVQGPWSGNSASLYTDTGYDIRDRIKTWGCIGTSRRFDKGSHGIIENLIHFDEEPQYGTYSRIEDLARQLSDEREQVLYYYFESCGGSSSGPVGWKKYGNQQVKQEAILNS